MPAIAVSEHVSHAARTVGLAVLLAIAVLLGVVALLGIPYITDALSTRHAPTADAPAGQPFDRR